MGSTILKSTHIEPRLVIKYLIEWAAGTIMVDLIKKWTSFSIDIASAPNLVNIKDVLRIEDKIPSRQTFEDERCP